MKNTVFTLLLLFGGLLCRADSPITSTVFYKAFLNVDMIEEAEGQEILSYAMCRFLSDEEKEVDQKMALINALGWSFTGKENAEIYWTYLLTKYDNPDLKYQELQGDELLSLAYLTIMDDYNQTKEPLRLASLALEQHEESYTYQMITALIRAQMIFLSGSDDESWCRVYETVAGVEKMKGLHGDMYRGGSDLIFDYIDLYKEYCPEEPATVHTPISPKRSKSSGKSVKQSREKLRNSDGSPAKKGKKE